MTQITASSSVDSPLSLRIITHNIRYAANPEQRLPKEPPWQDRLPPLSSQFCFLTRLPFSPAHSVICMQEVLTNQIDDLSWEMGREWSWVGVGRDDGKDEGERCVIVFRKRYWRKVHFETVWLNETGEVGKKGWDAGSVRVVSCLVVDGVHADREEDQEGLAGGKRILIMNTHLDNAGVEARKQSASILLEVAGRLIDKYGVDFHAIVGDLNSEVDGHAYNILNSMGSGVADAMLCIDEAERERKYGEYHTYTGFDGNGDEDERLQRIDFLFVALDDGASRSEEDRVKGYAVLPNGYEDGTVGRMSDHRPVCVDLVV